MIEAFTGMPGAGKTYHMVKKAYYVALTKKRPIYANFHINFNLPFAQVHYFKELSELESVSNALILIDEAGIYLPSQAWRNIPFEFIRKLRQHRHDGLDLWYTAQDIQDVATYLRRITQFEHQFSRVWKIVYSKVLNPRTKVSFGFDFSFISEKYCNMYDTTENVDLSDFVKETMKKSSML